MIEAIQRKQIRKSIKAQEMQSARDFQSKVLVLHKSSYPDC